jgi:predicted small lipoprotein YifL
MKYLKITYMFVILFSLTSCGQRGDLYMPDTHKEQTTYAIR